MLPFFLIMCVARFVLALESYRQRSVHRVVDLLINRHYERFQEALEAHLAGPDGDSLSDKNSYELVMQEVLSALTPQFVVIQSVLTDHVLIPQCRSPKRRAFLVQYRVVRRRNFTRATVEDHLEYEAHVALGEVDVREEAAEFVSQFRHVKELVKIGLAFFNRSRTHLMHKIEYVNRPKKIESLYTYDYE
jgi:hypothetical protein